MAALLAHWSENSDLVANAPVITIDLAPLAVAPDTKPNELLPGPQQAEAEPEPEPDPIKPVEKLELPPEPKAELPLAVTPPPMPLQKPKEEKPKQQHASLPSAPSTAENKAERAAAPTPGAASRNPYAVQNWKSRLVATAGAQQALSGRGARARRTRGGATSL